MDRTHIDRFEAGADILSRSVSGLTREQLLAFPIAGTWSIQQIVVHLLESDLAGTHRMRRVIAEDNPLLIAYDETACSRSLFYEHEDIARVCRLFEDNRRMMVDVLRRLPDAAFDRVGVHNQAGKVTLGGLVEKYVVHVRGHMTHLIRKRELLGAPAQIFVP